MLWMIIATVMVALAAGGSILATIGSRRDIASGNPTFDSVADVTGIWNRSELDRVLGPRDDEDRYCATAQQVYNIPPARWKWLLDNSWCDAVSLILALTAPVLYAMQSPGAGITLLGCSAAYQLIGYGSALVAVVRSRS